MIDDSVPAGILTISELLEYLVSRLGTDQGVILLWQHGGIVTDAECLCKDEKFAEKMNDTIEKLLQDWGDK